jgi:amino acid adenylation domain-containing protein
VGVQRDLGRSPLFDVMLILHTQWTSSSPAGQDSPGGSSPSPSTPANPRDFTLKSYYYEKNTAEFDLTLIGFDREDGLVFRFEYGTRLFREETIRRFIGYFKTLVEEVLAHPRRAIGALQMIPPQERQQLLDAFNDTALDYPRDRTIPELFSRQAEQTPDRVAVKGTASPAPAEFASGQEAGVLGGGSENQLTYNELAVKSAVLAGQLKEKGVKAGTIVGLLVQRTTAMMVGLLGILKAGAMYLPLDPDYPGERIRYILARSGAPLLVTRGDLPAAIRSGGFGGEIMALREEDLTGEVSSGAGRRSAGIVHRPGISALDPAYVIYTSGSTGNPKGIVVCHRNAVNFIYGMASRLDFSPGRIILALTTISFDIFFLETLLPVCRGLKVVIADGPNQKDPRQLSALLQRELVSMVQVTPSRLGALASLDNALRGWERVETLIVGGEAFPHQVFMAVRQKYRGQLYNVYGPTETTIWSTVKALSGSDGQGSMATVTLGTPLGNTQIYIVNRLNRLQPPGAAGELLIGGEGVAMGYLNNPELTAEKFIRRFAGPSGFDRSYESNRSYITVDNVFSSRFLFEPQRTLLYRTGDLARWQVDGELEFLGRLDQQVKIRGFRIELEEIEEQLCKEEAVRKAVVVSRPAPGDQQCLCAYLVSSVPRVPPAAESGLKSGDAHDSSHNHGIDVSHLRESLSRSLPHYMIPSYFLVVEQIPLTPNGKVNRSALPAPDKPLTDTRSYLAPVTSNEKVLAEIWKEVLQVSQVGVHDNFFQLGGNSLNVLQLSQKLAQRFGREIPVALMFRNLTIGFLDRYLQEAASGGTKKDEAKAARQTEVFEKAKHNYKKTISKFRTGGG